MRLPVPERIAILSGLLLLAGSVGRTASADPSSEPWQVTIGADKVSVFHIDYIPVSSFFFAYAVADRPHEVFVSTGDITGTIRPQGYWTPPGMPTAAYVFVLNTQTHSVSLMSFEQFRSLQASAEEFTQPRPDAYPQMNTGGEVVAWSDMVSIRNSPTPWLAAVSYNASARDETTFGIPSLFPFLGRQKFFETRTVYNGTVYLDLFEQGALHTPHVRLQKHFEDFTTYPGFTELALWVQGAEQPQLLLLERDERRYSAKATLRLVAP